MKNQTPEGINLNNLNINNLLDVNQLVTQSQIAMTNFVSNLKVKSGHDIDPYTATRILPAQYLDSQDYVYALIGQMVQQLLQNVEYDMFNAIFQSAKKCGQIAYDSEELDFSNLIFFMNSTPKDFNGLVCQYQIGQQYQGLLNSDNLVSYQIIQDIEYDQSLLVVKLHVQIQINNIQHCVVINTDSQDYEMCLKQDIMNWAMGTITEDCYNQKYYVTVVGQQIDTVICK